jgi:hypothetical protein
MTFINTHVIGGTPQSHYLWYTCNDPEDFSSNEGWQPNYGDVDSETGNNDTFGPYGRLACACWPDQNFVAIGLNTTQGNLYFAQRQPGSWPHSGYLNNILNMKDPIEAVACTTDFDDTLYVCGIADPAQGGNPYLWYALASDSSCTNWQAATTVSGTPAQMYRFYGLTCALSDADSALHSVVLHRVSGGMLHFTTATPPTANSWSWERMPVIPSSGQAQAVSMAAGSLDQLGFPTNTDLIVFAVTQYSGGLWYATHQQDGGWTNFTNIAVINSSLVYRDVSCALAAPNVDNEEYVLKLFALDTQGNPYYMDFLPDAPSYSWTTLNSYESDQKQFSALAATSMSWNP